MIMMYFAFFVSDWLWQTSSSIFLLSLLCFRSITCFTPCCCRFLILTMPPCIYICLTLVCAQCRLHIPFLFLSINKYIYIYIFLCVSKSHHLPLTMTTSQRKKRIEITYLSSFFFSISVVCSNIDCSCLSFSVRIECKLVW